MARSVPAVVRALDVLELFLDGRGSLSAPEVAASLDLPRTTTHELLATLSEREYVERLPDNAHRFRLGVRVYELGSVYADALDVVRDGQGLVDEISARCGETCQLGLLDGRDVVYVARAGASVAAAEAAPGPSAARRAPALRTAAGRVLLAHMPRADLDRRLLGGLPAPSVAPADPVRADAAAAERLRLWRDLSAVVARGVATDPDAADPATRAVAAAVRDHAGRVVAALEIRVAASRWEPQRSLALETLVRRAAVRASTRLGFRPPRVSDPGTGVALGTRPAVNGSGAATNGAAGPPANGLRPAGFRLPPGVAAANGRPDGTRPDGTRPDTGRPDHPRPDYARPEYGRPENGRPDQNRPEVGRPGLPRRDGVQPDAGRPVNGGPAIRRFALPGQTIPPSAGGQPGPQQRPVHTARPGLRPGNPMRRPVNGPSRVPMTPPASTPAPRLPGTRPYAPTGTPPNGAAGRTDGVRRPIPPARRAPGTWPDGRPLAPSTAAADIAGEAHSPGRPGENVLGGTRIVNGAGLPSPRLNGVASSGPGPNGSGPNGASLNGASLNGASLNGTGLNGTGLNGTNLNGAGANGVAAHGTHPDGDVAEHGSDQSERVRPAVGELDREPAN